MKEEKISVDHYKGNFKKLYEKKYGDVIDKRRTLTPEQVFDLAVKYFSWAEANAIVAAETASFQGEVSESQVHKPRVFTVKGMRLFCSFSEAVLNKWRKDPLYSPVMEFIDSVIYEQKFQLAVNGIINPGFVAKDLGIDKPAQVNVEANANSLSGVTEESIKEAVSSIVDML